MQPSYRRLFMFHKLFIIPFEHEVDLLDAEF